MGLRVVGPRVMAFRRKCIAMLQVSARTASWPEWDTAAILKSLRFLSGHDRHDRAADRGRRTSSGSRPSTPSLHEYTIPQQVKPCSTDAPSAMKTWPPDLFVQYWPLIWT